ncbi:MAG TPA: type II secretion system protein [Burkholderiales bacterium]|nr:type II secretion system protein [Burkholderiales bacterium]
MIFIVLMGIGLALAGQVWHTAMQREKEKELLFVGDQFRTAITKYYEGSPGGVKKFPNSLQDLLEDRRYPTTKRHLRKIYRDPMTNEARWGLVESPTGGIMGVHSLSTGAPRKVAGFHDRDEAFTDAASYADWKFGYAATAIAEGGAAPATGEPRVAATPNALTPGGQSAPASTEGSKEDALKRTCENSLHTDLDTCVLVGSRDGADAATRCDQSAAARNKACMDARPMPPLDINTAK